MSILGYGQGQVAEECLHGLGRCHRQDKSDASIPDRADSPEDPGRLVAHVTWSPWPLAPFEPYPAGAADLADAGLVLIPVP